MGGPLDGQQRNYPRSQPIAVEHWIYASPEGFAHRAAGGTLATEPRYILRRAEGRTAYVWETPSGEPS